ncbi:MAG: recombinase family protein [Bdellovibrionales bacterium]
MGSKIKAVAYARVSRLLGQDPKLQLIGVRQFAEARGYDLVTEYVDEGISGSTERRPGLDRLIADARQRKFDVIVTAALDRLSRSTKHFLNLFDELHHYGVSVVSLRENLDFTSPTGKMVATVLASVATLERQIISERIRTSLAAKKQNAKETGNGWRCGRPSKLSPELMDAVQKLRASGSSIRATAKALAISKSTVLRVCRLLQNPSSKEMPNPGAKKSVKSG